MRQPYCKHCGHPAHRAECGVDDCGCVKYEPRIRREPERLWVVQAAFFVKNRWWDGEARVRAAGLIGATAKGLREVKRDLLPPRTRVQQTKVTVVPVKGGRCEGSYLRESLNARAELREPAAGVAPPLRCSELDDLQ